MLTKVNSPLTHGVHDSKLKTNQGGDTLGYKLKEVRTEKGMSVLDLAEKSGISRTWIWAIESGNAKNVSVKVLLALANALGVTIDEIFFEDKVYNSKHPEEETS